MATPPSAPIELWARSSTRSGTADRNTLADAVAESSVRSAAQVNTCIPSGLTWAMCIEAAYRQRTITVEAELFEARGLAHRQNQYDRVGLGGGGFEWAGTESARASALTSAR